VIFCESTSKGSPGCYCSLHLFIKCMKDLMNNFANISLTKLECLVFQTGVSGFGSLTLLQVLFKF
jgi:hypothetical protein